MFGTIRYTGDGVTTRYPVTFTLGFLRQNYVKCLVQGEINASGNQVYRELVWDNPNDNWVTIQGEAPTSGSRIEFTRDIPIDYMLHDLQNRAPQTATVLNENNKQLLMAIQEIYDSASGLVGEVIQDSNVTIRTVTSYDDMGVTFDVNSNTFIFRVMMGNIALSDALDGTHTAAELVGASEYAVGQLQQQIIDIREDVIGTIATATPTSAGLIPAWAPAELNSLPFAGDSSISWGRIESGNSGIIIKNVSSGGLNLNINQIDTHTYNDVITAGIALPTVNSVYALIDGVRNQMATYLSGSKTGWLNINGNIGIVWFFSQGITLPDASSENTTYTWYWPRSFKSNPSLVMYDAQTLTSISYRYASLTNETIVTPSMSQTGITTSFRYRYGRSADVNVLVIGEFA